MKGISTALLVLISIINGFSQSMPIEILPSGHILVKANVDGKEGRFIFDTGAGINLFFDSFANDLNPEVSPNFITGFRATGERIDGPLFRSEKITWGGKDFFNVPYTTFDMRLEGIDGLISLQMLGETDFVIDLDKKEILLTDLSKDAVSKSFAIQLITNADRSTDITTEIWLNDQLKIQVLLDSGAGDDSFWISDKFISPLGMDRNTLGVIEKKSEFDEGKVNRFYKGTIHSISNQYVTLKSPEVVFVEGLIYEGKTSLNWLGRRIGISLKNKKMYIME